MNVPAGADAASEHAAYGFHWPHPLFPYQKSGIARLLTEPFVLLADEMGLGKTIQALAALRILVSRGEARRILLVCPAGLIVQWRQQARSWAPELTLSTAIGPASYASLRGTATLICS
jgi:SNF2 family DNA or RNA helicase